MAGAEHILDLFFFFLLLFYLHVGFTAFEGKWSNWDRRPGNPAEWRTESPGQPCQVNGVSVAILPLLLCTFQWMWAHRPRSQRGPVWSRVLALSLGSWNEPGIVGRHRDSEMRPKECDVSSPDVSVCFLEPCIRMQTSTSWMIRSAQWMQKSAGICLNSEFAPIFYHLCFPGTL